MKQRIAFALIIIAFAMSGALHYREYRKSQEISDILQNRSGKSGAFQAA